MKSFTKVLTIVLLIIIGFCTPSLAEHGGQLYYLGGSDQVRIMVHVTVVSSTGAPTGEEDLYSGLMFESKDDTFGTLIIDKYMMDGIYGFHALKTLPGRVLNPGWYNVIFNNVEGVVTYRCQASNNGNYIEMVVKKMPMWLGLVPPGEEAAFEVKTSKVLE